MLLSIWMYIVAELVVNNSPDVVCNQFYSWLRHIRRMTERWVHMWFSFKINFIFPSLPKTSPYIRGNTVKLVAHRPQLITTRRMRCVSLLDFNRDWKQKCNFDLCLIPTAIRGFLTKALRKLKIFLSFRPKD